MSSPISLMPKQELLDRLLHSNVKASTNTALIIASCSLRGQTTWDGKDYDSHYLRVAFNNTMSEKKRIVGILHDVIEDTRGLGEYEWTLDDLRTLGFEEDIVLAVEAVTKNTGEGYFSFIERGGRTKEILDDLAIDVKMNDLKDNMDTSRNNGPDTEHSRKKNAAYRISYFYLLDVKKGDIEPGSSIKDWMLDHKAWKNHMDIYEYFEGSQEMPSVTIETHETNEPVLG